MNDRFYRLFGIYYFLYYVCYGAISPYVNVYLESVGLSGSQIGQLGFWSLLAGMAGAPLFGILADKLHNVKLALKLVYLGCFFSLLAFSLQKGYLGFLITFVCFGFFKNDMSPLSDGWTSSWCGDNGKDFSIVRTFGSFGYLFGAFGLSYLLGYFGFEGPFIACSLLCYLLSFGLCFVLPQGRFVSAKFDLIAGGKEILHNRYFLFAVAFNSLSGALIDTVNGYVGNHMVYTLGFNSSIIGIYTVAMIVPELFFVFYGGRILNRFGYKAVYVVAALSQVARLAVYAFSHNIVLFILLSGTHGILMISLGVGNNRFLSGKLDRKVLSTGFSIYSAWCLLVNAVYSRIFGLLYEHFGSYSMFMFGLGITFILLVMTLRTRVFDGFES